MSTVSEHYERLLAKHYTWMFGAAFEEKVSEQKALLSQLLGPLKAGPEMALAVDLGCGPGFQTIAMVQLGLSPVVAIDTSTELLDELRGQATGLPIQIEKADLCNLSRIVEAGRASVAVCMGDTLTHLPGKADVRTLLRDVFEALRSGGKFAITYRDLSAELHGTDRFIPVRSDDRTIMTCFLEYESADAVVVHDLVYTRESEGWSLNKSSYRKLRLGIEWLLQELGDAGFSIVSHGAAGRLSHVVAAKP